MLTAALFCALISLNSCASANYAGIPLTVGAADPELQELARRARAGDKHAQLELGTRYEEGRGLPIDLRRAEELYAAAARDTSGTRLAYVPASGRNGRPMTLPISSGTQIAGLPIAQERLDRLRARRSAAAGANSNPPHQGHAQQPQAAPSQNLARQAFIELILLDHAFLPCAARRPLATGNGPFDRLHACLRAAVLPDDCSQYAKSLRRAAELVAARESLAILAPVAVEMILTCPAASEEPPASGPLLETDRTVVELVLGYPVVEDPRLLFMHSVGRPLANIYHGTLCGAVIEQRIPDVRLSEMLLCSTPVSRTVTWTGLEPAFVA